jgi:hypothetical protein
VVAVPVPRKWLDRSRLPDDHATCQVSAASDDAPKVWAIQISSSHPVDPGRRAPLGPPGANFDSLLPSLEPR